MQNGQLLQKGESWFARWYDHGKRKTKKLGSLSDYPKEKGIISIFQSHMSEVNETPREFVPDAGTLLRTFVNDEYFPRVTRDLRGSTRRGYKAIWNNYVEPHLGAQRVRDIRTFDIQRCVDAVIRDNKDLKKNSLARVKSFLSGVFGEAIRAGLRKDDQNPVQSIKVRGVRDKSKGKTFAYSLDDIRSIIDALTEPSRVLMAVAAYTGLRRGEIVGLKWEDYDGDYIHVRRNICFGEKGEMTVELPKTESSEAAVPVIKQLRRILDAWKAKAQVTEGCWIFPAGFTRKNGHPESLLDAAMKTPLSPANVLRDVVSPALEKAGVEWLGYHAFRRGLATNLRALGTDDLTISEILRHSDVKVTRASYIKVVPQKSVDAMNRFEVELAKPAKNGKGFQPKADAVIPAGIA
jgi:integrase